MLKERGMLVDSPNICVILAAINEEEGIGPTLAEVKETLGDPTFLVVDGNSVDKTVQIAKEFGAEIYLQNGIGKGNAISQGIESVSGNPDFVAFIDADFTYPAKYFLEMVDLLKGNPEVGMVIGNRFNHLLTSAAMKNPYYVGNRILAIAQHFLNGVKLNDPLTGFRLVRWKILKGWKPKSSGFDIEAEMNHHVERQGFQIKEVSIPYRSRLGQKKLTLTHGFTILGRMVIESLQTKVSSIPSFKA